MANTFRLRGVRHCGVITTRRSDYDVANMQNSCHNTEEVELLFGFKPYDIKSILQRIVRFRSVSQIWITPYLESNPFFSVVNTIHFSATFVQIFIILNFTVEKQRL